MAQIRSCFERRRDSEGKEKNCSIPFDSYQGEIVFEIFFQYFEDCANDIMDSSICKKLSTESLTIQEIDLVENKLLKIVLDESFNKEDSLEGLLTYVTKMDSVD
ncbi:hypothetical protein NPIL_564271 [Nephila pilipes]|uniref:Uncharacterized protein n=1 Tax=Nephila pilipes TaxID=299642 RepID=A0A8X6PSN2_NEPPI|nr:hypothetical protein NPIL_564271 [Nephila pilipes]